MSRCTAPAISGTATTWGTARVGTPAATAERTPVGESSMATQSSGDTPSSAGRRAVGLGVRLAVRDLVAGDHGGEGARQRVDDGIRQRPPRHRDERAGHALRPAAPTSSSRAPGRHGTCSVTRPMTRTSSSSTIRSGSHCTAELSLMNGRGHEQVVADELVGELVAPRAAVLLDDLVLRGDPVGLGVDEGAVHVPEDRCGEAHGWRV